MAGSSMVLPSVNSRAESPSLSTPRADATPDAGLLAENSGWLRLLTASANSTSGGRVASGSERRALLLLIVGLATVAAIAVRLDGLVRSGFVTASWNYDDAVFLGSAIRLIHGVLPYRDFVLIVPPGATLLLTPFAAVGNLVGAENALVAARLAMPFVGGANVLLLGLLLRRQAPIVVLVACFALALYPDGILTDLTVMLEPILDLFCLLGAVLLFDGDQFASSRARMILGGLAFGVAGAVKVWAILPVAVLGILFMPRLRQRLTPFASGTAAGFLVVCGPFLIAAPRSFLNQVVLAQLGRSGPSLASHLVRLEFLSGLLTGISAPPQTPHLLVLTGAVCAALVGGVGFAFGFIPVASRQMAADRPSAGMHTTDLERFALTSAVVVLAALMWPPEFWYHYPAFFGPFLALVLGLAAGRLAQVRPLPAVAVVVVVLAASAIHALAVPASLPVLGGTAAQIARVDSLVPAGACVLTDDPEFSIEVDRFTAGSPGCPQVVDSFGTTTSVSHTDPSGVATAAAVWFAYFRRAQYLMLSQASATRIVWTPALQRYVYQHFTLVTQDPWLILKRSSKVLTGKPGYHVPPPLP